MYDGHWSNGKAAGGSLHTKKGFDQGRVYTGYKEHMDEGIEENHQGTGHIYSSVCGYDCVVLYLCAYMPVCICW